MLYCYTLIPYILSYESISAGMHQSSSGISDDHTKTSRRPPARTLQHRARAHLHVHTSAPRSRMQTSSRCRTRTAARRTCTRISTAHAHQHRARAHQHQHRWWLANSHVGNRCPCFSIFNKQLVCILDEHDMRARILLCRSPGRRKILPLAPRWEHCDGTQTGGLF